MKLKRVVSFVCCSLLATPVFAQVPDVGGQANAAVQAGSQSTQAGDAAQQPTADVNANANVDSSLNTAPRNVEANVQSSTRINGSGSQDLSTQSATQAQLQTGNPNGQTGAANRVQANTSNQIQAGGTNAQLNARGNLDAQRNGTAINGSINSQANGFNGQNQNGVNTVNGVNLATGQYAQPNSNVGGTLSTQQYYHDNSWNSSNNMSSGVVSGMGYVPGSSYQNVSYSSGTSYPASGWSSAGYVTDNSCCCPTKRTMRRGWRVR